MSDVLPGRPRRTGGRAEPGPEPGAVVLPATPSPPVVLNPTALAIWELCDGETSVEEMVEAVSELFGLDADRARTDVETALLDMLAAGVIR